MMGREALARLARETGAMLAELGVRPSDRRWIARHAETLSSLDRADPPRRGLADLLYRLLYRLARRAARTAR
jgi:hypothetical protein